MRRRPRIDLGQPVNEKEAAHMERKSKRWAQSNKHRPESENPFLSAIKPEEENYGDPNEDAQQLQARLESLEFGNYPGYFKYRNKAAASKPADEGERGQTTVEPEVPFDAGLSDERLAFMKEEWFRGKQILDIGCNRGHITYAIARLFSPKFILGIDIDLKIIAMANRDLHMHLENGLLKQNDLFRLERACKLYSNESGDIREKNQDDNEYTEERNHMPLASYVNAGPIATSLPNLKTTAYRDSKETNQEGEDEQSAVSIPESIPESKFPNNILFIEHNYVLSRDELVDNQAPCFDTIVCLSVTKWIHLNYRDEGLKRFLKRIYRHLNPGGLLVLEAQPYENYHRKKKLSDRLRSNFYSIKFKPEQMDEYLLSEEVGFREIVFSTTTEHECAGFKRPLKVFMK